MGVNPARYLDHLIRGLDDDGLEELTLRYFKPQHPDAHRTRRGSDGGNDVLSDYELPPARGWQCKSSINAKADWRECRKSIKAAMNDEESPAHYTFVFNFALSFGQRDFWRKTLLPELREAYPGCTTIDYIDNFERRIESREDLIDWLSDGAFGVYLRRALEGMRQAAQSTSSPAADAIRLGESDAAYSYEVAGREAASQDQTQDDRTARFSMSAGRREQLPRFSLTTRQGDAVTQVSAIPRDGVDVAAPQPWFALTPEGQRVLFTARSELAKGRPVTLSGPDVGISGGDVPTHFSGWVRPGQHGPSGELGIGLSEPLKLTLTMEASELAVVKVQVRLYQVPPEPGAVFAYAGAIGGAVLSIDLFPAADEAGERDRFECRFTVTLALSGETGEAATKGLGFARAFGEVDRLRFACPGLLPPDGYEMTGQLQMGDEEASLWRAAATLASALHGLTERDGLARTMPDTLAPVDLGRAQKVLGLLAGPVEVPIETADFDLRLPQSARLTDIPSSWLTFSADFGPLVGHPTGLEVEQRVVAAEAREIRQAADGALVLACTSTGPGTRIVARLATT